MRLKLAIFVPAVALAVGVVVGFLDAESHHISDQATFVGIWAGAGTGVALLALLPALIIGAIWNAVVARASK